MGGRRPRVAELVHCVVPGGGVARPFQLPWRTGTPSNPSREAQHARVESQTVHEFGRKIHTDTLRVVRRDAGVLVEPCDFGD